MNGMMEKGAPEPADLSGNVTAARLSEWQHRALLAAEAALKERERDDRDDETLDRIKPRRSQSPARDRSAAAGV